MVTGAERAPAGVVVAVVIVQAGRRVGYPASVLSIPSALLLLLLLLSLLVFLVLLRLDAVALLHLAQAQGVRLEGLQRGGLLLLDREERIFADFSSRVARVICVLDCDEVLVRGTELLVARVRVSMRISSK